MKKISTANFVSVLLLACCGIAFGFALMIGLDKELERQEQVHHHHCKHYGKEINNHYGREICPPTPRG